jgi:hypothetical protein
MQVTSCCNLLVPVRQLSSSSRSARMSFSHAQRVFIVKQYLASCFYLTCQNVFRDIFPNSPVPNRLTVSHTVNCFRDTGTLHRVASNMRKRVNACNTECGGYFLHLIYNIVFFFVFWFQCNLFFDKWNVSGMGCVSFRSPCIVLTNVGKILVDFSGSRDSVRMCCIEINGNFIFDLWIFTLRTVFIKLCL